jgi:hypothetical protein
MLIASTSSPLRPDSGRIAASQRTAGVGHDRTLAPPKTHAARSTAGKGTLLCRPDASDEGIRRGTQCFALLRQTRRGSLDVGRGLTCVRGGFAQVANVR